MPVTTFTIREGRAEDRETIVRFNAAMAQETEELALDGEVLSRGVEAVFADATKGFYLLAVEEGGGVRGMLMVTREWSDWRNAFIWWVQSVYVEPDARGSGAFGALYREVRNRARAQGVPAIRLYVDRDNYAAQAVYGKLGMMPSRYEMREEVL